MNRESCRVLRDLISTLLHYLFFMIYVYTLDIVTGVELVHFHSINVEVSTQRYAVTTGHLSLIKWDGQWLQADTEGPQ